MINIQDKYKCCGCAACVQKCPKQCISLKEDTEGFLYPYVNADECIDCELCEKVCQSYNSLEPQTPISVFAAINNDEVIREKSSSGGIFYMLAKETIEDGGVVFGVRFDTDWQVVYDYTEDLIGVEKFLGSKYIQARCETAYKDTERFLNLGRRVLFSGTPCVIAGLFLFLRKKYDNLITVDFACHGVPSPKVWRLYLSELMVSGKKTILNINFRNKDDGWKKFNFNFSYNIDNETVSLKSFHRANHYMRAFLSELTLRPSCYNCIAKGGRSQSDITIADFWGVNVEMPEMDDDKGTSILVINTEKGSNSIRWNELTIKESSIETASKYNGGFTPVTLKHPKRERFFAKIDKRNSICGLIDECLSPISFKNKIKQKTILFLSLASTYLNRMMMRGG